MRLNFRVLLLISAVLQYGRRARATFYDEINEHGHNLLRAAMIMNESKYQYMDTGLDKFPAFRFRPGSEVKQPYRLYLPEKLPAEFTLVATIKPKSVQTSYLFAVLNPLETVVQLGIRISEGPASNENVSLVYTSSNEHSHSEEIAKFTVPKLTNKWSQIVIKVSKTNITLYLNCDEIASQKVVRIPEEMVFDSASTLYIAQAGPHIQGKYNGALQSLKLYAGYPQDLSKCTTDLKTLSTEHGSGDDSLMFEGSGGNEYDEFLSTEPGSGDDSSSFEGSGYIPIIKSDQEGNDELDKNDEVNPPPLITPPPPDPVAKGIRGEKGEKGEKGDKGENVRGPPGSPGPPGRPGPPGAGSYYATDTLLTNEDWPMENENEDQRSRMGEKGEPGSCTCNTTALIASFTMPKMIQGPKGESGVPGKEGKQGQMGLAGVAGPPGERGRTGATGAKGDKGDVGSIGPEGPQGQKGDPGRDGIPGEKGAQGPPGPPGKGGSSVHDDGTTMRPGLPGHKGDPGTPGKVGPKGETGIPGDKGIKGEAGLKGSKGDYGKEGPRGLRGFKGEPGAPGIPGIAGSPGENGQPADKGAKGDSGPEGKPGPPGPPGPAAEGVIGRVPGEGAAGAGFDGIKGDKGDSGLRGYKGDLGPKGEKGDKGDSGIAGIPGTNGIQGPLGDKGEPGNNGIPGTPGGKGLKGDRGERGPPGEKVFSGASDYISVKGERGADGNRGRRGRPGPPGPQGPPGKSGPVGQIGLPGWMGRPGKPGMKGTPGSPGSKGDKGEPGTPSTMGVAVGVKGEKGSNGFPGMPGQPGSDGQRGPPGPPGAPGMPAQGNYAPVPGPPGPPGSPGLPGISITGQKSEPGIDRSRIFEDREYYSSRQGGSGTSASRLPTETSTKIVPGAVTFQNNEAMVKMSNASPVGTLAYIIDEEALLVRVNNGWQYIALGSLLPTTTPAPATTLPPPAHPPFEASNSINQIPMKAEGTGLRMAALNEPTTGDMHGIRGADYACFRQSRQAGLKGTFRAFLSSRDQNVNSIVRLSDRDLPIVNIKGDVLFNSWKEIFNGSYAYISENPRIYSFNGKSILSDFAWPEKVVWHGSNVLGVRAMDDYCDAWHSSSSHRSGLASPLSDGLLLEQVFYSCDLKFAVVCVEVTTEQARRRRRNVHSNLEIDEDDILSQDDYDRHLDKLMAN